jgi:hypothetical protein
MLRKRKWTSRGDEGCDKVLNARRERKLEEEGI